MVNVGSISDQTLAGIVTTASHGSGITYGVMSTNVKSLHLLLASGERVVCNAQENKDLFEASLCGLGATGMILNVELEVEKAFRLREVQRNIEFGEAVERIDEFARGSQHTRLWWFPAARTIRVSMSNRTDEVSLFLAPFFSIYFFYFGFLPRFCLRDSRLLIPVCFLCLVLVLSPSESRPLFAVSSGGALDGYLTRLCRELLW
jgi:L-gulonolactone oxidase